VRHACLCPIGHTGPSNLHGSRERSGRALEARRSTQTGGRGPGGERRL
jgi:hypothetical protein